MSDASALNVSGDSLEAGPSYSYSFSLSSPSICSSSSQLTISPAVSKFLESTRLQTIFELRCLVLTHPALQPVSIRHRVFARGDRLIRLSSILAIRTWVNPI